MRVREAVQAISGTIGAQAELLLPVIAFVVPFLVSGPQWLTGTLVNSFLFLAAIKLSERTVWLVVILPSIGALFHGVLFGKFTPFLAFFLPFIWIGNLLLARSFLLFAESMPSALAVVLSSLLKAGVLYLSALVYFRLQWVPAPFLVSMGVIQLTTALLGGWLSLVLLRFL
jgi:hypothetical protein